MRRTAWVWLPLAVLTLLTAPSVWFMLPNYQSDLGENYEPLKTLRFAASLGADYHKYGPMTSFLLLPSYAVSMAWWWLRGTFTRPSSDFPYGFTDPLWQLTSLILQARVLFLLIFLGFSVLLLLSLRRVVERRLAVSLAYAFCIATSYGAATYAGNDRPDGPAFAFVAGALAMYARLLADGPRMAPACWMSAFAVFAISCKELAGPLFVLPYLGLGAHFWRETAGRPDERRQALRVAGASVGTGVGTYLLVNVVYAPATWLLRMQHWLGGEGTSAGVWRGGPPATALDAAWEHAGSLLTVLGPGGSLVALAAFAALVAWRPRFWALLCLPFLSILLLGLVPLGFPGERFYTFACVALVPPVALGIDAILARVRAAGPRRVLAAATALGLVANFLLGTFAWHQLDGFPPRAVERALEARPFHDGAINLFDHFSRPPGKSRLEYLGYRVDPRSIQEIMAAPRAERPARIYVHDGDLGFLRDAKGNPERTAFLRGEGFDVETWNGLEALGYRRIERFETDTPWWFPYDWVPGVVFWRERNAIDVYELAPEAAS